MREAINAAIIIDSKILLVKKQDIWILPGGKIEEGESQLECLVREVKEELSGTLIKSFRYYNYFYGISPHKGDLVKAHVYFACVESLNRKPSAEISEAELLNYHRAMDYPISEITKKVLISLYQDKHI